jgi:riboflavin synthase
MFTGIVTAVGTVTEVERQADRLAFRIDAPYSDLEPGESIAVSGACLTVVECQAGWFKVEAIVTTRGRTWFGDLQVGDTVNLERSLRAGSRRRGRDRASGRARGRRDSG